MKTKETKSLNTIDGATLMSTPLRPLNFVVDTLLSQVLHILAGSPKVGKSWLALWLAVSVAKGEPIWGMGTRRGTTLCLCLEDSTLRIQNRLFEITEDAPANVHFCTESFILGKAKIHCIGRDIEYREIELTRSADNIWEMVFDSRVQPELQGDRFFFSLLL